MNNLSWQKCPFSPGHLERDIDVDIFLNHNLKKIFHFNCLVGTLTNTMSKSVTNQERNQYFQSLQILRVLGTYGEKSENTVVFLKMFGIMKKKFKS